jgi:hypothetical protein
MEKRIINNKEWFVISNFDNEFTYAARLYAEPYITELNSIMLNAIDNDMLKEIKEKQGSGKLTKKDEQEINTKILGAIDFKEFYKQLSKFNKIPELLSVCIYDKAEMEFYEYENEKKLVEIKNFKWEEIKGLFDVLGDLKSFFTRTEADTFQIFLGKAAASKS